MELMPYTAVWSNSPTQCTDNMRHLIKVSLQNATGGTWVQTPDCRRLGERNGQLAGSSFKPRPLNGPSVHSHNQLDPTPAHSVADQVQELKMALSVNKSELAHILDVTLPTIYSWLAGGQPNANHLRRIVELLKILRELAVTAARPLFPRFVRSSIEPGDPVLLEILVQQPLDESRLRSAIIKAKSWGDAITGRQKEREARLRELGYEEPTDSQQIINLHLNTALNPWPYE